MIWRMQYKQTAFKFRGFKMGSFFISIINERLLVMASPSKMSGYWPKHEDRAKMEDLVQKKIDWSEMSKRVDMSEIMGRPMCAVTFSLLDDQYDSDDIYEYTDRELCEIALSLYGGPVGVS